MTLSVVIPAFNEEEVLEESYRRIVSVLDGEKIEYELIFVNDGSRDKTLEILNKMSEKDTHVKVIDFSRNFGHQVAISAGMDNSSGDAVVIIDADLQDPPEVIPEMLKKWREGYEVVYGRRKKRDGETIFKKVTAKMFYRFMSSLSNSDMPLDTGDFRLIDRKVCDAMRNLNEHNRYVRGLIGWMGFKQTGVEFDRAARFAGETKYSLKHMLRLAGNGIFSFSAKPLKLPLLLSILMLFAALGIIICKFIFSVPFIGSLGVIFTNLIIGACICLAIGIIGEYISRITDEVRGRPYYIISNKINFKEEE